ncbi:MAG: hypothetical protein Q9170_002177 [Blastenia crenularia]
MREIAQSLGLTSLIQKRDIVEYVYTQRVLEADPGSDYHDANYNYLRLSAVIELVTKQDYLTWLIKNIIQPAGLFLTGFPTFLNASTPNSAAYVVPKDQRLGPSALDPNQPASDLVPLVFGGDGMIREVAVGCLGLASSASYLASFIHQNAVQGHGGSGGGNDGVDWAFVTNSRDWNGYEGEQPWKALVGKPPRNPLYTTPISACHRLILAVFSSFTFLTFRFLIAQAIMIAATIKTKKPMNPAQKTGWRPKDGDLLDWLVCGAFSLPPLETVLGMLLARAVGGDLVLWVEVGESVDGVWIAFVEMVVAMLALVA